MPTQQVGPPPGLCGSTRSWPRCVAPALSSSAALWEPATLLQGGFTEVGISLLGASPYPHPHPDPRPPTHCPVDCDCSQCASDLWLSAVVSPAAPGVAVCPEHAEVRPAGTALYPAGVPSLRPALILPHKELLTADRLPTIHPACRQPLMLLCRSAGAGAKTRLPPWQPGAAVPPLPPGVG